MSSYKNLWILGLLLVGAFVLNASAEPEPEPKPEPAKALRRSGFYNDQTNPKFRSVPLPDDDDEQLVAELRQAEEGVADANEEAATPSKGDASSGRLFLKKFLLFRNMFGNSNTQPVIPIIITGNSGTSTGTTAPTTTITSSGTIPTATGTITTSPATRRSQEEEEAEPEGEEAVNVQALQAALAAGAQEYVVTDQEIKGTSDSKASKQSDSINLRRKGGNRGQIVQVRIPPKYRRYFKNGQRVMVNAGNNRGGNRRVVKKRVNKNRRRVNRNKKNRLVPAA